MCVCMSCLDVLIWCLRFVYVRVFSLYMCVSIWCVFDVYMFDLGLCMCVCFDFVYV